MMKTTTLELAALIAASSIASAGELPPWPEKWGSRYDIEQFCAGFATFKQYDLLVNHGAHSDAGHAERSAVLQKIHASKRQWQQLFNSCVKNELFTDEPKPVGLPKSGAGPLFHGTFHDCESGDDFGGHLLKGFVCRGTGTGVGVCVSPAFHTRVLSYDMQMGPAQPPEGYCHLDWVRVDKKRLDQLRRFTECKGSNTDCYSGTVGEGPPFEGAP
jgi:hypothetical protein